MSQVLHIFMKDVRHLRIEISVVLAAVIALAFTVVRERHSFTDPSTTQGGASTLLTWLLPLAWSILIARLIYAEGLVGTRKFWITRPYRPGYLMLEKALFILVFVNLPKLVADAIVVDAYGFQITSKLGGLLWAQVLLTAIVVLPAAALSTVTAGLVQFVAAASCFALVTAGLDIVQPDSWMAPWLALEWIRRYSAGVVIVVAAAAIIWRQYGRKGVAVSRSIAFAALALAYAVLVWLPWPAAFALQSHMGRQKIDAPAIRVAFATDLTWRAQALVGQDGSVDLTIPLQLTGLSSSLTPKFEGIVATLASPDGTVWHTDPQPSKNVSALGDHAAFHAHLSSAFYRKVKNTPALVRGSLYLTMYGNPRQAILPVAEHPSFIATPGAGLCLSTQGGRSLIVNCRSALKTQPDTVQFDVVARDSVRAYTQLQRLSSSHPVSYMPFPADVILIPVTQTTLYTDVFGPVIEVSVLAREPVAHIRSDFEIPGLRLADFEVHPSGPRLGDFDVRSGDSFR